MMLPDFSYEAACGDHAAIGIDEAGRGPWAGPVVAGAAWVNMEAAGLLPGGIRDSKKLSPKKRAALWDGLQRLAEDGNGEVLRVAVGRVESADIDRMGILPATFAAMEAAVLGLDMDGAKCLLVDGPLRPPFGEVKNLAAVTPIKKGDDKSVSIAIAAIAAKQTRDAVMTHLDAEYPAYGWKTNMGYGTAAHHAALRAHGVCPQHRRSFRPVARLTRAQ